MATEASSSAVNLENGVSVEPAPRATPISDDAYWSAQYLPVLSSLLRNAGSYTPEEQASHLRFIKDYVIPNVGPQPTSPDVIYVVSHFGSSTFEASINLNDKGKPCVRFTFEPHGPLANDNTTGSPTVSGYPYKQVRDVAGAIQADMGWFNELASELFILNEQDIATVNAMMPPSLARVPQYYIALDLNGGQRQMKVYFCPLIKQMVTGLDSDEASFRVLNRLDPGFAAPLQAISDFRAACEEPLAIQMIGIDCVAPEAGARVKLYTRTESNTMDNVRNHVTLGGRRNDETTLKGLEVLSEVWHLLLDEPQGLADPSVSKPVNDPTNIWHTSIIYSWEVQPRKALPDVKVYVPLWQYSRSNRAIAQNLEKVFEKQGWSWGIDGTYRRLLVDAFGEESISGETPTVFTHVSFNFSKNDGTYIKFDIRTFSSLGSVIPMGQVIRDARLGRLRRTVGSPYSPVPN
ncbi:hypothetical protein SLS62_003532 [Diatrype stigma]|uniref:Aromatic prenyltransferase n=1 Tax=Diatrype stigma TaxID=117547 RepID=A0AAN9UWC3_9PEZI